mgnify:FL=1
MSGWAMTLDVSDVFHREGMATVDKAKAIAARIQTHRWADSNGFVCDLADELAEQTDPDAFDVIWDAIYDEADRDRVWVKTR